MAGVGVVADLANFYAYMKDRALFDAHFKAYVADKFFLENFKEGAKEIPLGGKTMQVPIEFRGSTSIAGGLEHEPYAEPDMPGGQIGEVNFAKLTGSILISLELALSSRDKRAAWASAQIKTMQSQMEMFGSQHSKLLFGDGSGAVAKIAAGGVALNTPVAGQHTLTLEPPMGPNAGYTFGAKYIHPGQRLVFSATKTGITIERTGQVRCLSRDAFTNPDAPTIIVEGTMGTGVAGDYVFIGTRRVPSKGRMPKGLLAMFSATNMPIYLGLDRTSGGGLEQHQAVELPNIGSLDLETEIQRGIDYVRERTGGKPSVLLMHDGVWRRHAKDLRQHREYVTAAQTGMYKGGVKGIVWNGADSDAFIMRHFDVPDGCIFGIDWSSMFMGTLLATGWVKPFDIPSIFHQVPGTLDYAAVMANISQPFCPLPGKNFFMSQVDAL